MKKLLYSLIIGVFVLLVQNAMAQMPPPTAPPGTPPMAGPNFDECKQMKPRGDYQLLKDKKRCFRDAARALGAEEIAPGQLQKCKQIKARGDFALMKQKKNCMRDLARSLMAGPGMPPTGDPNMPPPTAPPGTPPTGDPNMPPPTAPPGTPPMAGRTVDECKQMKPRGDYQLMKDKKRCFRDAARALGAEEIAPGELQRCKQIKARGDFALMKQKKNCMRDLARSLMAGPGIAPGTNP